MTLPKNSLLGPLALPIALLGALCGCAPDVEPESQSETPAAEIPTTSSLLPGSHGDEDVEVAAEIEIARELPALAFVELSHNLPDNGSWRGYPDLLDFTGDGRAELVVSNREEDGWNVWTYLPGESFTEGQWQSRVEGLSRMLMYGGQDGIDVDHDGDLDLVLSSHQAGLQVYRNNGAAEWSQEGPIPLTKTLILDVCGLELNGDKYRDVVGIGQFKGGLNLYIGNEQGSFDLHPSSPRLMGFERKAFGMQVEAGDFDGDGDDDILAAAVDGVRVFLTKKDEEGKLAWRERSSGLPRTEKIGNILRGLCVANFVTGSKNPQVAFASLADPGSAKGEGNTIGVLRFDPESESWFSIDSGLWPDQSYTDLKAAEFNGDGKLDLLVTLQGVGGVIFLGDGQGGFTPTGRIEGVRSKAKLAVGDVNGDGLTDIAASAGGDKNGPSGSVRVFLNGEGVF